MSLNKGQKKPLSHFFLKIYRHKNKFCRLNCDGKIFLSRQKISSVRTFWAYGNWTFFLCPFSKFKKSLPKGI
jgi:hypothetical protein